VANNLISVIDDDESVRRTTTRLIESFGFRAAAFDSAENFLGSGHLNDTSCLIVDVQMPGMNGLQLQSQLAAAGSRIPIIFITAFDDKESRRRAMQAGAIAFLGKPFNDEQLLQGIRLALHEFGDEPGAAGNLMSIIDDDESARRSTTRLIESFGFRAAAFESAESLPRTAELPLFSSPPTTTKNRVGEPCKPALSRFWQNLLATSTYFNGFVRRYVRRKAALRRGDHAPIEVNVSLVSSG
jgi:FixJ family two-component response regulator